MTREAAYDALPDHGRAAVDITGDLEDCINTMALHHAAEVSGLSERITELESENKRLRAIEAAAVRAVLAGHYTARQELVIDLTANGALTREQTRAALHALDKAESTQ